MVTVAIDTITASQPASLAALSIHNNNGNNNSEWSLVLIAFRRKQIIAVRLQKLVDDISQQYTLVHYQPVTATPHNNCANSN